MPRCGVLSGRRLLVVEDDFILSDDLARALAAEGATVVGPSATVADALELIARQGPIDGAVLDVKLLNEWVYPVADALRAHGVPFVFATGYDATSIERRFDEVPRLEKPVDVVGVGRLMFGSQ